MMISTGTCDCDVLLSTLSKEDGVSEGIDCVSATTSDIWGR